MLSCHPQSAFQRKRCRCTDLQCQRYEELSGIKLLLQKGQRVAATVSHLYNWLQERSLNNGTAVVSAKELCGKELLFDKCEDR